MHNNNSSRDWTVAAELEKTTYQVKQIGFKIQPGYVGVWGPGGGGGGWGGGGGSVGGQGRQSTSSLLTAAVTTTSRASLSALSFMLWA